MELLRLTQKDDCSAQEIAETLQKDPALTGRILQLANSAAAGASTPVTTVTDATVRLGIKTVRCVALGFSLVAGNRSGTCAAFDYDRFWSESLANAVLAQVFSKMLRCGAASEAFVCGLLSQIGSLALATVHPDAYAEILGECDWRNREAIRKAEQERFGIDHGEVGGALFQEWGLPPAFSAAVLRPWGRLNLIPADKPGLPLLMFSSVRMAAAFLAEHDVPADREKVEEALSKFSRFESAELGNGWNSAIDEWRRWGNVLDIRICRVPQFEENGGEELDLFASPVVAEPVAPVESVEESPTEEEEPVKSTTCHILLATKDADAHPELRRSLLSAGYQVTHVQGGQAALRTVLEEMPQVVLADREMDELAGLELCQALRKTDPGRKIYFIMLAQKNDEDLVVRAFDEGVDDYVITPVQSRLLLARVRGGQRLIRLQEQVEEDRQTMQAQVAELGILTRKLQQASITDALTELPNRRYAIDRLDQEWKYAVEKDLPFAVLMLDIDFFKRCNDDYGHDVGDAVLRSTAGVLRAGLREQDVVCRLGGEEFCALLRNTNMDDAVVVAERLRLDVEKNVIQSGEFDRNVTVSIGAAVRDARMSSPDVLLKAADTALYQAKESGRNRVVSVAPQLKVVMPQPQS